MPRSLRRCTPQQLASEPPAYVEDRSIFDHCDIDRRARMRLAGIVVVDGHRSRADMHSMNRERARIRWINTLRAPAI